MTLVEGEEEAKLEVFNADKVTDKMNWVHAEVGVRTNGRCQSLPKPEDEDEEGEGAAAAADDTPPEPEPIPPLRSIADDPKIGPCESWTFRAGSAPSAPVMVAKSVKWPG